MLAEPPDVFVIDHAEYNMDLLIEGFVNGIELYMDIFDSINIMSRVTDNIRIAVYFLPTPHQTGELTYVCKTCAIVLGSDVVVQTGQCRKGLLGW